MNRRGFLGLLGATIAGIAVEQAIPFGRVWSFPKEIIVPTVYPEIEPFLSTQWISMETLRLLKNNLRMPEYFSTNWEKAFAENFRIGAPIAVRFPPRRLPD